MGGWIFSAQFSSICSHPYAYHLVTATPAPPGEEGTPLYLRNLTGEWLLQPTKFPRFHVKFDFDHVYDECHDL